MTDEPGIARAVAAAQTVARAHSVASGDPVVVAARSNVLVHLRPAPVIARVMSATAALHADVESWLTREIAVGSFLGERGLAVAPSDVVSPGPHHQDGLWMTFWEFVEHDASRPRPRAHELGASLRELHAALADFPGEVGQLSEIQDWLGGLLAELHPSPDLTRENMDSLRSRLQELTPTVFESALPTQVIHGDASLSNLLRTDRGLLWNDLEDVCAGPVHWDVAGLMIDCGDGEALLDAYGGLEPDELHDFIAAHRLYTTIWRAFDAQRRAGADQRGQARISGEGR